MRENQVLTLGGYLGIFLVLGPLGGVVEDVLADTIPISLVPNDVFVVVALP